MSWLSKLFKNVSIRDAERAVKKLLRDEPWLKDALRELAQDELLRLNQNVQNELSSRLMPYATGEITLGDVTTGMPTIYGGDQ